MRRGKELVKNTVIIAIGNLSTKIIFFFLLPLYTSLLSTKDYGTYDLLITYASFIVPIVTLLIEESMFRFLIDCKNEVEKKEIISQTFFLILFSTSICTILYLLLSKFITIPYSYIFLLYIISNIICLLKNALSRGLSMIKLYTVSNFISSILLIILNIVFIVWLKLGVVSLLLSSIISNMIVSLFVFSKLKLKKYISYKKLNKKKIKEMINYSFPLVTNSLSWTIINLSDRIIVSKVLGLSFNGIYSMACKFPTLMDNIYGFFYTSWTESAAKSLKDSDSDIFYNKVYVTLKNFMWSVVIMMIAIMPFVFNLIIKKDFVQSYLYIPILILAMYFSNISGFFGGIFTAYKDTKIMGKSTMIAAGFNLIINIIFIKYIGLWAAAISTLISTFIAYSYRRIILKKYIRLENNKLRIILCYLSLLISIVSYYSGSIIIQLLSLFILSIYVFCINKMIILKIFSLLKRKRSRI